MVKADGRKYIIARMVVAVLIGMVAQVDGVFVRSRNRRRLISVEGVGNAKIQHFNALAPSDEIFNDYARDFQHSKGR
jgi:hypothetical protein